MTGRRARAGCAPSWGAAVLALWALIGAQTAHGGGEGPYPPLPPGTTPHAGMPPFLPDERGDRATLGAWCDAMEAAGRTHAGTRRGGDLLFAAAHARAQYLNDTAAALRAYAEAGAHYPPGDPTRAVVLFHQARREAWRGHPERAEARLRDVQPWLDARPPADLTPGDAARWEEVAAIGPGVRRLRADLHEAHGRFAEAAQEIEALAVAAERRGALAAAGSLWQRAATLRHRAGDREAARSGIEEALSLGGPPADRAQRGLWRLYLGHGLLTEDGALGLWSSWPGEAFERDLQGYLRGLAGSEAAGTYYLSTATAAFAAGRPQTALAIYRLALGDALFLEQARGRPDLWRGLLVAFPVALGLGRHDEAERILATVERLAVEPLDEMDAYRIALQEARAQAAESQRAKAPADTPPPPPAPAPAEAKGAPLGRIETGAQAPAGEPGTPDPSEAEAAPAGRLLAWLTALGGVLLLALLGWRARRRPG